MVEVVYTVFFGMIGGVLPVEAQVEPIGIICTSS
jgi:hypothetical protein